MKIKVDDWDTCYPGSHFELDVLVLPRIGETLRIHKSLMAPRFFTDAPYLLNPLEVIDDYVLCTVIEIVHDISPDGHTIEVCIEFDIDD